MHNFATFSFNYRRVAQNLPPPMTDSSFYRGGNIPKERTATFPALIGSEYPSVQHACPRIRNPFVQLGTSDSERTTATGKTGKSERPRPVEREVVKPDPSHNKVNHHSVRQSDGPPSFPFAPLPPPSPSKPVARLEIPVLSTLALIPLNYLTH